MPKLMPIIAVPAAFAVFAAACAASGAGGRQVQVSQRDAGCTPASIAAAPGEKLQLVVSNQSGSDYEIEGIEGAKLDETLVPKGSTRKLGYTVPSDGGTQKLKCYVPTGPTTIIEVVAGRGATPAASAPTASPTVPSTPVALQQPSATLAVALLDYSVTLDKASVQAGVIRFVATNAAGDQPHELAVLHRQADGTLQKLDEVHDIAPGKAATLTLDLRPGTYVVACLIAKGEGGSPVDHYQAGMHTELTVR